MNRKQRRALETSCRHEVDDLVVAFDRGALLRIVAAMVEVDDTVSGATIITPDGRTTYVSAAMLRQGGHA
jgi:hypothetical protein